MVMNTRFVLLAVALTLQVTPLSAADIQWEVANRFRLFKSEAQFRALLDVFQALPSDRRRGDPALALETELEMRAADGRLGKAFGGAASLARYGWASAVVDKTCFQPGNKGHWPCLLATGDQFLLPAKFDLIARLTGLSPSDAGRPCAWVVAGRTVSAPRCDADIRVNGLDLSAPFDLSASLAGTRLAFANGQIARNVTIVGLGDSVGSGEGNPDRPAVLGTLSSDYSSSSLMPGGSSPFKKHRLYPLRPDATPTAFGPRAAAHWQLDQCHRSLYSNQLKAALGLALEQTHLAVTYLGYACTGASVDEGLLGFWEGRADIVAKYYDASPQLMRALRDLCADQKGYRVFRAPAHFDWRRDLPACRDKRIAHIDALLLSIGGNDIGFSGVIAHELVDSRAGFGPIRSLLYKLWLRAIKPVSFEEARQAARQKLPDAFSRLSEALKDRLELSGDAVLQTAYPQFTELGANDFCAVGTQGMDVHEILGIGKQSTGPQAARFVDDLNQLMDDALGGPRKWQLVTEHVAKYSGHAICRAGADADVPQQAIAGGMQFPYWNAGQRRWLPFAPPGWVAYRPKYRWFVTPDDAFLTVNYMVLNNLIINARDKVEPLVAATLSGAFHPNALGQAAIADAVLTRLRKVVGTDIP
jgi:hypothetical protein